MRAAMATALSIQVNQNLELTKFRIHHLMHQ
jgi:hypothetical protein